MSTTTCGFCGSDYDASLVSCPSCGGNFQMPDGPLPSGTGLNGGKFTIVRVLGRGGFGITYEGYDETLHRTVAIKELFPEGAVRRGNLVAVPSIRQDAFREERAQVVDEARRVASLKSSNIVEIYTVFQENDTVYIVMEFLSGNSLEHVINQSGSLRADEVQAIALALCNALQTVHGQHMLHRDIKPANVMLTDDGRTVLIDFGAAREFMLHRTSQHTRLLTEDYAAPEQYATEARFGPYTDIFSLGATLFHAWSGSPPKNAIERSLDNETTPVLPDGCQGPLGMAIQSSLHLWVGDRPQDIDAFRNLLRPEVDTAKKRWPIPRQWRLTAVTGTTILLAVAIGWYSMSQRQANLNLSPSVSSNPTATPVATHTSTPAPTRISTATPTTVTIAQANLRQGPSTAYPIVGQVHGPVEVVAQSPDLQWLQLANDAWIYRPLVTGVPTDLPIAIGVEPTPRRTPARPPTATPTKRPAPTPAPQSSVNSGANLRGGPGTEFPIVGGLPAGSPVEVKSRTESGDWLQLASGAWIAAFLIDDAPPRLPVATNIPVLPTPTFTPVPIATPTPTIQPRPTTPPARPTTLLHTYYLVEHLLDDFNSNSILALDKWKDKEFYVYGWVSSVGRDSYDGLWGYLLHSEIDWYPGRPYTMIYCTMPQSRIDSLDGMETTDRVMTLAKLIEASDWVYLDCTPKEDFDGDLTNWSIADWTVVNAQQNSSFRLITTKVAGSMLPSEFGNQFITDEYDAIQRWEKNTALIYGEIINPGFEPEEGLWGYIIRQEQGGKSSYTLYCTMPPSRAHTMKYVASGDFVVSRVRFLDIRFGQLYLDCSFATQ